MGTDLDERLQGEMGDLAQHARGRNHTPEFPTQLWRRGVRRQRRRRAAQVVGSALAVGMVVAGGGLLRASDHVPAPSHAPLAPAIPRRVAAPDQWAPGTKDTGPPGVLAYVGRGDRSSTSGSLGHSTGPWLYGVSARTGLAVWLDLPRGPVPRGAVPPSPYDTVSDVALSPNGRYLAWDVVLTRHRATTKDGSAGQLFLVGWNVYDTVTGHTTYLRTPAHPFTSSWGTYGFSADSRYLASTTYDGSARLLVGNVRTGTQRVIPTPGASTISIGQLSTARIPSDTGSLRSSYPVITAGESLLWTSGRAEHLVDPARGESYVLRTLVSLHDVSRSPDGHSLCGVRRGQIWCGAGVWDVRDTKISGSFVLGWRRGRDAVIGRYGKRPAVLDTTSFRLRQTSASPLPGATDGAFDYASGLWARPLWSGVAQPSHSDPTAWFPLTFWTLVLGGPVVAALTISRWRRLVRA